MIGVNVGAKRGDEPGLVHDLVGEYPVGAVARCNLFARLTPQRRLHRHMRVPVGEAHDDVKGHCVHRQL
jgi:hypothetical protein